MKLTLFLLNVALAVSGLFTAADASTVSTVYISVRADGLPGSGTEADPFDGSSQEKFDALMKSIAPNTQINLSAGTFLTNGADEYSLKNGWTIKGAGMGVTTIKLAGHLSTNAKHYNLGAYQVSNVEVTQLTCDGNDQGWDWPAHDVVGGLSIYGNNLVVDHVETINCYGDSTEGLEEFSIFLSGEVGNLSNNLTIQNCLTHTYAPGSNYTNGPLIAYCNNAQIINCTDDGANHGFGFAGTVGAEISGCTTTSKTVTAYYTDTSSTTNLTIEDNSFSSSQIPIQFNSAEPANDIKILNNTLEAANNTGSGSAAIVLSGASGNNIEITGNVFTYVGRGGSGLILNNGKNFTDLDVEDNSSNVGLSGAGGSNTNITDVAIEMEGNKFNQPIASLAVPDSNTSSPTQTAAASSTTPAATPAQPRTPAASTPSSPTTTSTASTASSTPPPASTTHATSTGSTPLEEAQQQKIVTAAVQTASTSPAQAMASVTQVKNSAAKNSAQKIIIFKWAGQDPESAGEYIRAMPSGPSKQNAVADLVEKWADNAPEDAATWLISLPDSPQDADAFSALARVWTENDSTEASDWLVQLPRGGLRDVAVRTFSNQMLENDPEDAVSCATLMSDTLTKQSQVAGLLRKWMQTDSATASLAVQNSSLPESVKTAILGLNE